MVDKHKKSEKDLQVRPPIVVILGHVDHGKTSILDCIRKTKVVEKESGGITQHVGAYQIEHNGKIITFIDTPGHEAFSAIRSRGAKVADIAVLVVAADDGVKPQTKEAINCILHEDIPFVVAINKMDKPAALPDKVKKELAENKVLVEGLGGEVPCVLVSAKTSLQINELLEMILLVAEMAEIKSDGQAPAAGVIIESRADAQRGATATLLVKEGTLSSHDVLASESAFGAIKTMEDFRGRVIVSAGPGSPVIVTGFNQVPPVGEEWQVMPSLDEARQRVATKSEQEKAKREPAEVLEIKEGQKVFNIILKADVSGSLEAIRESLKAIPQDEVIIRILKAEVGDVSENDVKLARSAKASIYGFRIKSSPAVNSLAERDNVYIKTYDIIYELIQVVRDRASTYLPSEMIRLPIGRLKVLATFKNGKSGQIVGGRVASGRIERGVKFDIKRASEIIGSGKVNQLQQNKQNVQEVAKDKECGIMASAEAEIEKNDILELFLEERKKREL
ncbi:MAG: Translation initiation factor IF-2 [Parcubacteria group bacterium GW2011_GWA2_42_11]|nr:MAG: Translation initiation factor IF-2 [Parcubacteria group bacterium GW2011_GWA2_42_11]KKT76280.1 MAG: Translation initiation factor IF-2 [Parcubacteria group bacterium GW2011_GWF2_44_7]